jgi:hypothetical protein
MSSESRPVHFQCGYRLIPQASKTATISANSQSRSATPSLTQSAPRMAASISGSIPRVLAKLKGLRGPGESYVMLRAAADVG